MALGPGGGADSSDLLFVGCRMKGNRLAFASDDYVGSNWRTCVRRGSRRCRFRVPRSVRPAFAEVMRDGAEVVAILVSATVVFRAAV